MKVQAKHRPAVEHSKGSKVTAVGLQFHGTVVDHHVSYRVKRALDPNAPDGAAEIVVGENEDLPEGAEPDPVDTHVSYLVHRHWDDTDVWVEPNALVAGHVFDPDPALLPAPSVEPFGAR
jgi:hypothetical protein